MKPIISHFSHITHLSIANLIDYRTFSWNARDIDVFFHHSDAALIKDIPLNPRFSKDLFTWELTDNGQFSVKSAYYLASVLLYG